MDGNAGRGSGGGRDDSDRWNPRCPPARGLVVPVRTDPSGISGPTRDQARRGRWEQTTHGFHKPAGAAPVVVEQRILEQSMRLGGHGAVTGWAALRLYGAAFFDGLGPDGRTRMPVPLVSSKRLIDTEDSVASRASLAGHGIWLVQAVRCVGVERAVVDEIIRLDDLRQAVAVIDMACAAHITSLRRIRSYLERFPRPATSLAARAVELASERSLSPAEVRMRLVWELDAGWPRPLVNVPVFSLEGRKLGTPDLLDVATGVAGEYDGRASPRARPAPHRRRPGRALPEPRVGTLRDRRR